MYLEKPKRPIIWERRCYFTFLLLWRAHGTSLFFSFGVHMVISGMSAIVAISLSLELLYGQARVGMETYKNHSI